ncbi:MAG: hypothetical protein ACP5MD_03760, partial [Verrucomicrobiia bacterium]
PGPAVKRGRDAREIPWLGDKLGGLSGGNPATLGLSSLETSRTTGTMLLPSQPCWRIEETSCLALWRANL